jgi:hypothetical protein
MIYAFMEELLHKRPMWWLVVERAYGAWRILLFRFLSVYISRFFSDLVTDQL